MTSIMEQQQRQEAAARGELSRLYTGINRNTPNAASHVGPDAPAGAGPGTPPPPGPLDGDGPGPTPGSPPPGPGDGPIPQIPKPGGISMKARIRPTTRQTRQIGGVRSPLSVR